MRRIDFVGFGGLVFVVACSPRGPAGGDETRDRLDGVGVSRCASADGDVCGGPSGDCWCDELCAEMGDCCADVVETCGHHECSAGTEGCGEGAVCAMHTSPRTCTSELELCLVDGDCGVNERCDHSYCYSPCPPDAICTQVCQGACVKPACPKISCDALCTGSAPPLVEGCPLPECPACP